METREDPPATAAGPTPAATRRAPRRWLRILTSLLALTALFAASFTVSWFLRPQPEVEPGDADVAQADESTAKKAESGRLTIEELFERGDEALTDHRFAVALASYDELRQRVPKSTAAIAYRIGLCREAMGQLDEAQGAYRQAADDAASRSVALAAQLALARCQLRANHPAEARRLLSPYLLDESRQQETSPTLKSGLRYLTALAWAQETSPSAKIELVGDRPVVFSLAALETPFYLDEIAPSAEKKEVQVETLVTPLSVQKAKDARESLAKRIELTEQPAWKLLDRLATEAGLHITWTPAAKALLEERTLHVFVHGWPVAELLEQAADRYDLVCRFDDGKVAIATAHEMEAKQAALAKSESCKRALRAAFFADKEHAWAPAVLLELGNQEATHGKKELATQWYERLIHRRGSASLLAAGCYNLALLYAGEPNSGQARAMYLRVIDEAPGHELALRACLRIARLHLEADQIDEAIVHLRRARTWSTASAHRPVATLLLAAANLEQGNATTTREILAADRLVLQKPPYKPSAMFLDAFAQYRIAVAAGKRRESSDVLTSLTAEMDDHVLGAVGVNLSARAYRELGFHEQAEQLLRKALAKQRGRSLPSMEFLFAQTLLEGDHRDEAGPLFEKVAAVPSRYRTEAILQLAQLDLEAKDYAACIERCRRLWTDGAGGESAHVLHLWGLALEATGELAKAARCFAGKAPE